MGKTVNYDEDLLPTDLVMARLVFGSNVTRTEVSSAHHSAEKSCAQLMLLQTLDRVIGCRKLLAALDSIYDVPALDVAKATFEVSTVLRTPISPIRAGSVNR